MSLKDQLLKAGLVDAKKARQSVHDKRREAKLGEKTAAELAQEAQQQKIERDKEMNKQQQAIKAEKELQAQIKQLISVHKIERQGGDTAYQFTDDKKIKKIWLTADQHRHLSKGQIALVKNDEAYEIIPRVVVEKIKSRDASVILVMNDKQAQVDNTPDDDPYADYKIPDDLMW